MSRAAAIAAAHAAFDDGTFADLLARRVAIRTESQDPAQAPQLRAYLDAELAPSLATLGFECRLLDNPVGGGPFLLATRTEEGAATTRARLRARQT